MPPTNEELQAELAKLKAHHHEQINLLKDQAQQAIERVVRDKELEIDDLLTQIEQLKAKPNQPKSLWTNRNLLIIAGIITLFIIINYD